jgi:hypothetical protein
MSAGPKLLAGFVLVPEIGASAHDMKEYSGGKSPGVKGRIFRYARKITNKETMAKVVATSPRRTVQVL